MDGCAYLLQRHCKANDPILFFCMHEVSAPGRGTGKRRDGEKKADGVMEEKVK